MRKPKVSAEEQAKRDAAWAAIKAKLDADKAAADERWNERLVAVSMTGHRNVDVALAVYRREQGEKESALAG